MKFYVSLTAIVVACFTTPVSPQRWRQQRLRQQQQQQQQAPAQYCVTPENYYGTCVTLSFCPQIANVFQITNRRQAEQYVILSQRACNTRSLNGDPVVCCTRPITEPQTTQIPFQQITGNPFLPNVPPEPQHQIQPTTERPTITTPSTTSAPSTTTDNLMNNESNYCRGPDIREGSCKPIKECQVLVDELQMKQTDKIFARFLRVSNTICGGTGTNVCCPNPTQMKSTTSAPVISSNNEIPTRLPTVEEGCGYSRNTFKKIVGGEVSKKGAWPWVALIGYSNEVSSSPFKCGGTLITARHVLTAAHCLRRDLDFVRLGEHDLTTDDESKHLDVRVVRTEKHSDYNRKNGHSDIAMLYLEHNVPFSETIAPICMPITEELKHKSYNGHSPFVVGWGKTMEGGSSSNVLQELQIPIYENQVCKDSYKEQNRLFSENQFDNATLCAGVLSGGKDTCQGDSGGPLMIPEVFNENLRFHLIGVVSYGIGCGRPQIPGVYASTQYFMDWIEAKIADTP